MYALFLLLLELTVKSGGTENDMKKKIYFIMILLAMIVIVSACSDNLEQNECRNIVTGGAVDVSKVPSFDTSVFGEDADEWSSNVEDNQLYREILKEGKNYSLYISNYPQIHSRKEAEGTINIGNEELYYSILTTGESEITYEGDDKKEQERTIKYKLGNYIIYKRVGNRFYTLWIDQELDEKDIKKKAKEIFDKYCTL